MTAALALGIDIGGTKIAYALVDAQGHTHATQRIPTNAAAGQQQVIANLLAGVEELLAQAHKPVAGIGVGVPGYVDPDAGIVHLAVNLGWHAVPLAQILRERFALPISVHKDANAAALGEITFGAAQGCRNAVCIAIGTGLGIGLVVDGAVVTGSRGAAGELAHTALTHGGRACACGLRGCPEAYISGVGLLAGLREHAAHYPDSALAQQPEPMPADILKAGEQGDTLAQQVLDEAFAQLAQILVWCAGLLNPERFVIGGGLGLALAGWLPRLEAHLHQHTQPAAHEQVRVVASRLESNALGAAALVWHAQAQAR